MTTDVIIGGKRVDTSGAQYIVSDEPVQVSGVYNTPLPTLTNGQQSQLQLDATGRLRVNASEVASGATDSGNPLKIGAVYNSTQPTFTTGQRGDAQMGTKGSINVTLFAPDSAIPMRQAIIAPTATLTGHLNTIPWALYQASPTARTEGQGGPLIADTAGTLLVSQTASAVGGYSFSNLKANATTTVKSGAGKLHTVSINSKGITNTVTIYDNTAGSGTTIATIDATLGQDTLTYDLAFGTGLTIVIAGGTAADITITYK